MCDGRGHALRRTRNQELSRWHVGCSLSRRSCVFSNPPKDTNMQKLPKVLFLAGLAGLPFVSGVARAEDPPPEHSFTGKVALYTEYEYRGISQTSEKLAGQLNLDYAHSSGLYAGTFLSNIKWLKDTAQAGRFFNKANNQGDIHGGEKFKVLNDATL